MKRLNGKPSLWNFWKDGITQSFLHRFMECREQTRLIFCEGWVKRGHGLPIEFGSCVHWLLSKAYKGRGVPSKSKLKKLVTEYQAFWEATEQNPSNKSLEQQEMVYGLAESVLPAYFKHWKKSDFAVPKRKKWLGLEKRFKVPYIFQDKKMTFLNGCFDGVIEDAKGHLWLFETKTKSRIDAEGLEDLMPLDLQVMFYLYALSKLYNKIPKGVVYNVIRRPSQRLGKSETLEHFFGRVADDVSKPERADHYFMRWDMQITKKEMKDWENSSLKPMVQNVRDWWEGNAPHYMNPDALITKYGRSGMYDAIVRKDYSQYYRRKKVFAELEDV